MLEAPVASGDSESFVMAWFSSDRPRFEATRTIGYCGPGDGVEQVVVEIREAACGGVAHAQAVGHDQPLGQGEAQAIGRPPVASGSLQHGQSGDTI
jgi:hypothetical protein